MYALANIEKFVKDNADRLGDKVKGILERAEKVSSYGMISGSSVEEIMDDDILASEFHAIAMTPEHLELCISVVLGR